MKKNKILALIFLSTLAGLFYFSCSKSSSTYGNNNNGGNNGGAGTNAVNISGYAFAPLSLTVKAGTAVTWTNNDPVTHTVTSDDGSSFNSGNIPSGSKFTFTPNTPGTYSYHCNIHTSMTAKLIVTQ